MHSDDAARVLGAEPPPAPPEMCVCGHPMVNAHRTPGTECAVYECGCSRFRAAEPPPAPRPPDQGPFTLPTTTVPPPAPSEAPTYDLDALERLAREERWQIQTDAYRQIVERDFRQAAHPEVVVALVRAVRAAQAVEKWSARAAGYSPGTAGANRSFSDACDELREALKPFGVLP